MEKNNNTCNIGLKDAVTIPSFWHELFGSGAEQDMGLKPCRST